MTIIQTRRPASTTWSTNPSLPRINGIPSHFTTRPVSSSLSVYPSNPRPLSICSTLSAVSATSSTSASSVTGDRRRRSAALLDVEAELDGTGELSLGSRRSSGIRNSLLRAEEVLRASERERELERRRDRAGFRHRQVRSAHLLDHLWAGEDGGNDDVTEDLSLPVPVFPSDAQYEQQPPPPPPNPPTRTSSYKRFSPKGLLKKARSIPVDMLLSPTSKRYSNDSSASETPASPKTEERIREPHPVERPQSASAVHVLSPTRPAVPRRAASAADLLSTAPTVNRSNGGPSPQQHHRGALPLYGDRYGTLPTRLDCLPLPVHEPQSKFSASSGDSIVHLVSFGSNDYAGKSGGKGFKDRARTFSQASTGGFKSLKGRIRTPSKSKPGGKGKVKRKPSLANLFAGLTGGGSSAEENVESRGEAVQAKGRSISFARSSRIPTAASNVSTSATESTGSGHRPSTSVSSYATSTATSDSAPSQPPSRKPSRLGFFRSTLREKKRDRDSVSTSSFSGQANGSLRNRTRSAGGTISPSIISRPLSVATSADGASGLNDKRFSEVTASSDTSSAGVRRGSTPGSSEGSEKKGWASRLSRAVKGKNVAAKKALFEGKENREGEATVQLAEKINVKASRSPELAGRLPSRIPLSTVFAHNAPPPARPPRPPSDLHSSDDTTFYGHRIPAVKTRAAAIDSVMIKSSAPRVRPKTSIPVAKGRSVAAPPLPPSSLTSRPVHAAQYAATFGFSAVPPAPSSSLLPPAPIYPSHSLPSRRWTPESFEADPAVLSSDSSASPTSNYSHRPTSPFRSPSPARFRDLLPSATAQSSPERNERGLPMPLEKGSPRSPTGKMGDSPKKRAMGPEQVIVMEDVRIPEGPITEVRGATTDLADLLSSLEETEELNTSAVSSSSAFSSRPHVQDDVSDLSASLRCHLPHLNSIETLRSTVSDVPADLKELIDVVDDHLSEVDILPSFAIEGTSMGARGFADEAYADGLQEVQGNLLSESDSSSESSSDEDEEQPHNAGRFLTVSGAGGEQTTGMFSSDGGGTTLGFDATTMSFEGRATTAGEVLRSVLAPPPVPPFPAYLQGVPELREEEESDDAEDDEEDPRSMLRDSVREALDVGRPSHGDKMFDRLDMDVELNALLDVPSPPLSPEEARQALFFQQHLRHDSMVSSTEGSLESHFTMNGSPTPFPRSGRPVRQSLARYSQDQFPTKRPSHRARPISEQSTGSSEQGHLSANEPTSLSLAQSSRSTNLSISSITSSPCPVPRYRRVPMLTRNPPPMFQPSFRFPPEKPSSASLTLKPLGSPIEIKANPIDELTGGEGMGEEDELGDVLSAVIKTSTSPRFVRPLRPLQAGGQLPRPRLLELQQLEDPIIPPDTPPPSSPSDGERHGIDSRQASIEIERPPLPPAATSRSKSKSRSHSRQTSRSSSILQSAILEELEEPSSPANATVELAVRLHLQPLSPIPQEPPSPQQFPLSPYSELPSVEIVFSPVIDNGIERLVELEADEENEDDFEFTAETNPELTRQYAQYSYEADMEIKRSRTIWPDTDASREALSRFDAPRTYHAILEFLFYSQNRFPSPPHLIRLGSFVPLAFDDPPTPPTPPSPVRIPSPIVDSSFETRDLAVLVSASPSPPRRKPAPPARRPLAAKPVNKQISALSQSTSSPSKAPKDDLSPFTALPPRLGSKLRAVRAKMESKSPKKKVVDTSFFGSKVSTRRQEQLDAAMRRLEGTGKPSEQRSDSESDFTGVLEAAGEATDEFTFTKVKTPRLSTQRPRVRRKTALSTLR
ncbi:hypothetical protein JCM8547_007209 [Rhodosporidiobolus lusitaniae]